MGQGVRVTSVKGDSEVSKITERILRVGVPADLAPGASRKRVWPPAILIIGSGTLITGTCSVTSRA